jgi:hypothetical protein
MNIYFIIHFFSLLLFKSLLEESESLNLDVTDFHKFGKTVINHSAIIIPPENDFQKLEGIHVNSRLTFSKIVKSIIETLSEPIIIRGIFLLFPSSALAQSTIGRRGKTQGAKTVRTQEKNAITRSTIYIKSLK